MKNSTTIKTQLAVHEEKLDAILKKLDEHCIESVHIRDEVVESKAHISWIKKGLFGAYGIVSGVVVYMIREFFTRG